MTPVVGEQLERLISICLKRRYRLAFAESCTGGLISATLSAQPGVSAFFQGSVVSYARSVKVKTLGVPSTLLQANGEVSLPTALAMARGVCTALDANWGLSVTGVAGPTGGSATKPVGCVCFAIVGPSFERVVQQQFAAHGGRQDIQRQATLFAFDFLLNAMI